MASSLSEPARVQIITLSRRVRRAPSSRPAKKYSPICASLPKACNWVLTRQSFQLHRPLSTLVNLAPIELTDDRRLLKGLENDLQTVRSIDISIGQMVR